MKNSETCLGGWRCRDSEWREKNAIGGWMTAPRALAAMGLSAAGAVSALLLYRFLNLVEQVLVAALAILFPPVSSARCGGPGNLLHPVIEARHDPD